MKSKIPNDKDAILSEWRWIYANFPKFNLITDVKSPTVFQSTIGQRVDHFKKKNYIEKYTETVKDEKYSISLIDDSIICFYYIFDNDEKLVGHNLSYIPSPLSGDAPMGEEIAFSKYIRADYDKTGYENVFHTLVHLHISIYKTEFRIPIAHFLSPWDFLYIILKYIYHSHEDIIDNLMINKRRESLLSPEEMSRLRIIIGE